MADGFDIHLNEDQARRLKAAAEAVGAEPMEFAIQTLEGVIGEAFNERAYPATWVAEDAERWAEYERTGVTVSLEDALRDFHANLARRLAEKP
ncbi:MULTISPECIES: hypothetical protein [Brevundimonas]|jgi:hypothetical protein|uniref:hypothetical protein n=1 Tax=Brevundimonas TaxID=41275 RepID=UPI00128EB511|nr:hypothetical protein [Brevundimonas sp. Bb-A]QFU31611.1 hypothetical protein BSP_08050 [Brevundimonas sp. Bb-A]